MKTVLVLGGTGMLGFAVGTYFQSLPDKYSTFLTTRDTADVYGKRSNWIRFDPTGRRLDAFSDIREVFERMPNNPDYVLNCIGAIKPVFNKSVHDSIYVNALFPHKLASICQSLHIKLINITSDCVYAGNKGQYVESDLHDAIDAYGKSKSLGESPECMTLRTSIIGQELKSNISLVAWAQSQAGKHVNGFANHLWGGVTTKQYADVCDQIISNDLYSEDLFHVHSDTVTKYELLQLINQRFNLDLRIDKIDAPESIDRSLSTEKTLMSKLSIPTLKTQIMDL